MPCLSGYRYCGPGCSGPGAPLNRLDVYCRQHDACYKKHNHHRCDEVFMKKLQPWINQRTKLGRDAAHMYRAMRLKRMF